RLDHDNEKAVIMIKRAGEANCVHNAASHGRVVDQWNHPPVNTTYEIPPQEPIQASFGPYNRNHSADMGTPRHLLYPFGSSRAVLTVDENCVKTKLPQLLGETRGGVVCINHCGDLTIRQLRLELPGQLRASLRE